MLDAIANAIIRKGDYGQMMSQYYNRYPHTGYGDSFQCSQRIDVVRYGLHDELLKLKGN
uniref:Uncharacterized protein n=1 Tax=Candidatus Kentrum sp. TUN TaxID=2126343 RepID=A0A450ZDG8_9GAMM|nr:MAG: hypothetical protein BECKTUN1418D_GA0071000_101123 [Candidatus Kentron sp. TUN]